MNEVQHVVDQLHRAFYGEAWHGPSVQEALSGVTSEQAQQRPVARAHSLWELTVHIGAWAEIARRRINREQFEVTPNVDWPLITDFSDTAWRQAQDDLRVRHEALEKAILGLTDASLHESLHQDLTVYALVLGVVQHHVYHAGQIMMLRKALG